MIAADISNDIIFAIFIIFCRIGTICMYMPTIGESSINTRTRLIIACFLSFFIYTTVPNIPSYDTSVFQIAIIIFAEIVIGMVIGISAKLMITTLHVLGSTIASMSSLASAMRIDPSLDMQGSLFSNFMTITFITLLFASDFHLMIIKVLSETYNTFAIGDIYQNYHNILEIIIKTNSLAFNTGIKLGLPFVIVSLLLYTCYGVLARVIPQFQIFFLIMPIQVGINFMIFMLSISGILMWFLIYYENFLYNMLGG